MLRKYSLFIYFKKQTVTKQILTTERNDGISIFLASLVSPSSISWSKPRPSSTILPCCPGKSTLALYCHLVTRAKHCHRNTPGNSETDKRCFSLTLLPASLTDLGPQIWRVGTAAFIQSHRSSNEPALLGPGNLEEATHKTKEPWFVPEEHTELGSRVAALDSTSSPRVTPRVASDGNSHLPTPGEVQRQVAYRCFEDPSEKYFVLDALSALRQTPRSWYTCTHGTRACRRAAECSSPWTPGSLLFFEMLLSLTQLGPDVMNYLTPGLARLLPALLPLEPHVVEPVPPAATRCLCHQQ